MKRRKGRVAILTRSLEGGGAERVTAVLANGFAQSGLNVDLILQFRRGPYLSHLDPKVEVFDLNRRVRFAVPKLTAYLRERRPDALFSLQTEPNILAVVASRLAGNRCRVVLSERSSLVGAARGRVTSLRMVYPHADLVIAVSEVIKHELADAGIGPSMLRTIHNPLSPELNNATMRPPSTDTVSEPPLILGVGRLAPEKDYPTMLRAFALVRKHQAARLVILGEGRERAYLESLVSDLGLSRDVDLPGFVDPPWDLMRRASLLLLSSQWEGWPNVLVEALAHGIPVVSTDCPTGPSEILDGGRYGRLVPVGDHRALASSAIDLLSQPPNRQQLRSRAQDWSADKIVVQYLDALGFEPTDDG